MLVVVLINLDHYTGKKDNRTVNKCGGLMKLCVMHTFGKSNAYIKEHRTHRNETKITDRCFNFFNFSTLYFIRNLYIYHGIK